jgi:nicotinic acid mononucleotide adenylyltransferase
MAAAMAVYAQTGLPVWFLPCYSHRFGKEMAGPWDRYEMCDAVRKGLCNTNCQEFYTWRKELDLKHEGSTYELLENLRVSEPEYRFHLIVGSDNVDDILTKWHKGVELIREHPLVIVNRPGYVPTNVYTVMGLRIQQVELGFPIASTDFRKAMARGDYAVARRLVLPAVWDYVVERGLYGYQKGE